MALIVETGQGVSGSNSYVSLEDARSFAANRGLQLSTDDAVAETQLVRAFDYIESLETFYAGYRVFRETCFPRNDLWVNGFAVGNDEIPSHVKYAQVHVALAIHAGLNPQPNVVLSRQVIREKVGDLERQFSSSSTSAAFLPRVSAASALLVQLFTSGSSAQLYGMRG